MSSKPASPPQPKLNIELSADLEAVYANFALISHTPSEVIIDYARIMPNTPSAKIHARIVMTPLNAKLLLHALVDNLQKFEASYGEVVIPEQNILLDRAKGFTG